MNIFIPSAYRYKSEEVRRGPLPQIPLDWWSGKIFYVVPTSQKDAYRETLGSRAEVLATDAVGIAKTRHWIGEFCRENDMDRFLMLDDDIRFIRRASIASTKLKECGDGDVVEMLDHIEQALNGDAHVAVSARGGNNNLGVGDKYQLQTYNTRTLRALAYRTEPFLEMEHGRVEVMEDFDVNLQLLERGYSNRQLGFWAQDQKMTNAPGGCSTYRTHDVHERSARRLMELHPGIVSLRVKQNKTDREGFGTRTEVTIQWKKAYQQGQQSLVAKT